MAFTPYYNVVGSDGVHVELIAPGDNAGDVNSIMLTNTHATAGATVSLSIAKLSIASTESAAETYYILNSIDIPTSTSLLLDSSDILKFDNSLSGYSMFITVGSSDTVDVKINVNGF